MAVAAAVVMLLGVSYLSLGVVGLVAVVAALQGLTLVVGPLPRS